MQATDHLKLDVTVNGVRRVFTVIYFKGGADFQMAQPEGWALSINQHSKAGFYHEMYSKHAAIRLAHTLVAEFAYMMHEASGFEDKPDSAWVGRQDNE
ncbi:MAG: hypothetical protein DRI24_17905 [Deltaproteobacteria bacterium]|nr:MAG: hypothetical protein DRI24_17905 [Deltaproteobacteria bacterium]